MTEWSGSSPTSPPPTRWSLQRHFANAAASGIGYLTMEVSSQALKYHRSLCTDFAAACFLNIGEDHISPIEHPDFEDYFTSKLRIFRQGAVNCVNLDCDHAGRVLAAARAAGKPIITFSQKDPSAQVYADQVRKEGRDILFHVRAEGLDRTFRLTMPGLFNVENALAAISICLALHIPEDAIYAGLLRARVPGRMEVYANADDTVVAIVDYAHNRMSFETLFSSVKKEYPGRRVVAVFGCPGKKAFDRRQALGEVSGSYSDLVILTEEDAGEEDPEAISREIAQYVKCPCIIENNRGEAIRQAILGCGRTPSVLLITGKGAETRQKRGTAYIDVPSDVDYVHAFLQEYDAVHHLGDADQDHRPADRPARAETAGGQASGRLLGRRARGHHRPGGHSHSGDGGHRRQADPGGGGRRRPSGRGGTDPCFWPGRTWTSPPAPDAWTPSSPGSCWGRGR